MAKRKKNNTTALIIGGAGLLLAARLFSNQDESEGVAVGGGGGILPEGVPVDEGGGSGAGTVAETPSGDIVPVGGGLPTTNEEPESNDTGGLANQSIDYSQYVTPLPIETADQLRDVSDRGLSNAEVGALALTGGFGAATISSLINRARAGRKGLQTASKLSDDAIDAARASRIARSAETTAQRGLRGVKLSEKATARLAQAKPAARVLGKAAGAGLVVVDLGLTAYGSAKRGGPAYDELRAQGLNPVSSFVRAAGYGIASETRQQFADVVSLFGGTPREEPNQGIVARRIREQSQRPSLNVGGTTVPDYSFAQSRLDATQSIDPQSALGYIPQKVATKVELGQTDELDPQRAVTQTSLAGRPREDLALTRQFQAQAARELQARGIASPAETANAYAFLRSKYGGIEAINQRVNRQITGRISRADADRIASSTRIYRDRSGKVVGVFSPILGIGRGGQRTRRRFRGGTEILPSGQMRASRDAARAYYRARGVVF